MTLTSIPVIYGAGLAGPDGTPAVGTITLQVLQETPDAGITLTARSVLYRLAAGNIAGGVFETNGQTGLQVVVYENVTGAKNPPPYIVAVPTSGTLDLSTADRGGVGAVTPLYIPTSARGVPGGVALLGDDGLLLEAERPPGGTAALWQIAEANAGLSDPSVLTEYSGNDPNNGITLDSGTYENFDFVCSELILPNDNTVLRNCRITCHNADNGVRLDANTGLEVGRYLEHCQITALGTALSGAGFTARLVEVVNNGDDSARIGRSHAEPTVLELCWFHDFRPAAGAHADGVQLLTLPAADVVILGCSVRMDVAAGYTVPPATGFTAAVFTDPADVTVPDGDPEPTRVGNVWVDGCLLFSADNFSLVVNGSPDGALPIGTDVRNSTLLPGTTAIAELNTAVTGANNVDIDGVPLSDIGIHSDPRSRYLTVGDPRQTGGGFTPVIRSAYVTDGTINPLPNTGGVWQVLNHADGTTPFSLPVPASVGDWVEISINAIRDPGSNTHLDVGVVVDGSIVRFLATGTATPAGDGDTGWYPQDLVHTSGPRGFTVTSGDLSGGNVTFALAVFGAGTGKLFAVPGDTFYWQAKNLGPHN